MAFLTDGRFRIDVPFPPRNFEQISILVQFVVRKYNIRVADVSIHQNSTHFNDEVNSNSAGT